MLLRRHRGRSVDASSLVPGLAVSALIIAASILGCTSRSPVAPESLHTSCIGSGDETAINAALSGAPGIAVLCQGATFSLRESIVFTRDGQRLYTQGHPTDARRATLRVVGPSLAAALRFTNRSSVSVSHIIVDGNRSALGRLEGGHALIDGGGDASGQRVEHVRAFEPRGWTAIFAFEGASKRCSGITIAHNDVGPAGQANGAWADGISVSCRFSLVHHNTITDATDGGIVIFGAAGSIVAGNTIRAVTRPLLGGIAMVDYAPSDGDYRGTVVDSNVIEGAGRSVRIGLAMGSQTWGCTPGAPRLTGAFVSRNALKGDMAYGYVVNGVTDWTVVENVASTRHTGVPSATCAGRLPSAPGPFQIARNQSSGTFQSEFVDAQLDSVLFGLGDPALQPLGLPRR